jgi:hypothetical protein
MVLSPGDDLIQRLPTHALHAAVIFEKTATFVLEALLKASISGRTTSRGYGHLFALRNDRATETTSA